MLFGRRFEKKLTEFQTEMMRKYYEEVDNMYRKMRGWRHDYRHHIQAMKVHMKNGDYEAVSKYLDELDDDLTNVEIVVKTGNRMADAILNSKLSLASTRDIKVKAEAKVPVSLSISELDLCIIIGNLLDNAIEACMKLPKDERLIRIYIEMKGSFLYMSVSNTVSGGKKRKIGDIFHTTKPEGHGYGLVRTDRVVKKYSGYITRASEDGAFTTEVMLPQAN